MSSGNLVQARRNFYTRNFSQAITYSKKIDKSDISAYIEAKLLLYRSLIQKGLLSHVIKEIDENIEYSEFKCLKVYAEYKNSSLQADDAIEKITTLHSECSENFHIPSIFCALIYIDQKHYNKALSHVEGRDDLECLSLSVHALLSLNRCDLALKKIEKMKKIDEDNIITQVTSCIVFLRSHDNLKEAQHILKDIMQLVSQNAFLISLLSIYYMNRLKWEKADVYMTKALEIEPLDQSLLFNQNTIKFYKGCSTSQAVSLFQSACNQDENHFLVEMHNEKSIEFDKLASMQS